MTKKLWASALVGAAACALVAVAAPAQASLVGSTVTLDSFFPDLSTPYASAGPAVVGAGVEFADGVMAGYQTAEDLDDNSITFIYAHNSDSSYSNGAFNGFHFTFTTAVPIGATLDASSIYAPISIQLTGNELFVNYAGVDVPANSFSKIDLTFGGANGGVPEPATWAMMLMGFGGLGATLRRRRAAVAGA